LIVYHARAHGHFYIVGATISNSVFKKGNAMSDENTTEREDAETASSRQARVTFGCMLAKIAAEYEVPQKDFATICGLAVMIYSTIAVEVHKQEPVDALELAAHMLGGLHESNIDVHLVEINNKASTKTH
jgi:hypothetical protein